MKKISLFLCAFLAFQNTYGQLPESIQLNSKLSLTLNKNIEFLGFGYFIAFEGVDIESKTVEVHGKEIPKKDWHKYGFQFYQKYRSYAENEHLVQALGVAYHLWLDYIIALLLRVDDFPNAKLPEDIDQANYIRFSQSDDPVEAKQNVEIFLDGLNKFYQEVDFDAYLRESAAYYQATLRQVQANLPNISFVEQMEAFYRKEFDHYVLIPSLTIPKGMGFGPRQTIQGKTSIYSAFGAMDEQLFQNTDSLVMGFGNPEQLRELSIHEFGHSFVNPEIYQLPQKLIDSTYSLFESLRFAMETQGYNTWKVCIIEHFVRAGEIMIARNMGDQATAERLKDEYINIRKFIYIPIILKQLEYYQRHKNYEYLEAVKQSLKKFE